MNRYMAVPWLGLLALLALLAGCGGGGGGGGGGGEGVGDNNGPVPLSTSGDAARELGNIGSALFRAQDVAGVFDQVPASAKALRTDRLQVRRAVRLKSAGAVTKAAEPCQVSGTHDVSSQGTKSRPFLYFQSTTQLVAFQAFTDSSCADTVTVTTNGPAEAGGTLGDLLDENYYYASFGNGGTPFEILTKQGTVTLHDHLSGTAELHSSQGTTDFRSVLDDVLTESNGYSATVSLGQIGSVFQVGRAGNASVAVNGTYTYSTSRCAGGRITVSTQEALVLNGNGLPVDGKLTISSGPSAVVYTFNNDGSATLVFNGGSTTTLTAPQVFAEFTGGGEC